MRMTRTPLRVSFFGGGTDYPEHFERHGGAVLGSAIDKFSYVTASHFHSRMFDYAIRVSYRKVELVKQLGDIEHAVFRECLRFCGIDRDIELHNVADLPAFSGLGSSSTFTVGLLCALHAFLGRSVSAQELAYQAIHIERNVLRENVGCQDQTFAAFGGFRVIEFRKIDDIVVRDVPLSDARIAEIESHLVMIFTRIVRRASDAVANQLRRVSQNLETLTRMRAMVDRGYDLLTGPDSPVAFGRLMHDAWEAKRQLASDVSNQEIDALYARAREHGAVGGKLLGAGGGGFLLMVVPPEAQPGLRAAFANHELLEVRLRAPGAEVLL